MDLTSLRTAIPALSQAVYLNTGTFGPSPTCVLDEVRRAYALVEQHGAFSPVVRQQIEFDGFEAARTEAARLLGASPDEITLNRNSSDGINLVAFGLDWQSGDEVLITDEEHPSGILPWLILARRAGLRLKSVPLHPDPEILLHRLEEQMTARTRVVFVSHISGLSGLVLPVREICRLAHSLGALAVVDGAHALGQIPVAVREIECDAYLASGHKWLLGPQGASFAFVAREHWETFQPSWIGWGAQEENSLVLASQTYTLQPSARRYEFGTKPWPLYPGLARAIRFIRDEVTLPAIQAHVRPLAAHLKQAIDAVPGLRRVTPDDPRATAGLVSLTRPGGLPGLKELLWERHKIIVAYNEPQQTLRLSLACFTTQAEVDQALAAIVDCLPELPGG